MKSSQASAWVVDHVLNGTLHCLQKLDAVWISEVRAIGDQDQLVIAWDPFLFDVECASRSFLDIELIELQIAKCADHRVNRPVNRAGVRAKLTLTKVISLSASSCCLSIARNYASSKPPIENPTFLPLRSPIEWIGPSLRTTSELSGVATNAPMRTSGSPSAIWRWSCG